MTKRIGMFKKLGLVIAACAMLFLVSPPKANAAVRFGIGVGVAPYAYSSPYGYYGNPYAYPYSYYAPPVYTYPYAYPYVGGYYGGSYGGGHWDRGWHGGHDFHGGYHGGFHGDRGHGGRR